MSVENFRIDINTGNAAFDDEPATELARILRSLADDLESGLMHFEGHSRRIILRDVNGNQVGAVNITESED